MRRCAEVAALFPVIRSGVLSATVLQPDRWWFLSELARHLRTSPSSLQRELQSLVGAGLLERRQDGRRSYFKANAQSPVFGDLRGLMEKTTGIVPALAATLKKAGDRVQLALLYGSVARGEEQAGSDVDLLIVGNLKQIDLVPVLKRLEAQFGREVNATLFSPREFREKISAREHFVHTVLAGKFVVLKGSLGEFEQAAARP